MPVLKVQDLERRLFWIIPVAPISSLGSLQAENLSQLFQSQREHRANRVHPWAGSGEGPRVGPEKARLRPASQTPTQGGCSQGRVGAERSADVGPRAEVRGQQESSWESRVQGLSISAS